MNFNDALTELLTILKNSNNKSDTLKTIASIVLSQDELPAS